MKQQHYLIILLFFNNLFIFSQHKQQDFSIYLGIERRLPNIFDANPPIYKAQDDNIAATVVKINLEYNLYHNYFLGFSEAFYYSATSIPESVSQSIIFKIKSKLLTDYMIYIKKSFVFSQDKSLDFSIGYAKMNNGDCFYSLNQNDILTKYSFTHVGYNLDLKYRYKNVLFGLGYYHIPYFESSPEKKYKAGIIYLTSSINLFNF